ncbi:MAG: helix-turn-helix domain-containing protein [Hyphomicrobiales bacterium]|nr:helix-turn-helix domain-containing protein [Hyphomicrobiales bacterium]
MIIRKLRVDKGFSQEQLADMAGVSTRTLQRIERGANASPETLKCLAAVLETDFTSLRKEQTMPAENAPILPELQTDEREAMEYVRDIKAFYSHAIIYGVVIVGLVILNIVTSPGYFWAIWPALGWGIGLAAQGLSVFEIINFFGDDWEKRQIERRLGRK